MIIPTTRTAGRVQRSTRKSALPGWLSDNERSKINGMSSLPIRRLQFFTIHTKNLETARQFYVDRLGFPIMSEQAGEYFQVAIAGVPVCVDLSKNNEPAQPNQIGIEVTDVDTITATLRNQGPCRERRFACREYRKVGRNPRSRWSRTHFHRKLDAAEHLRKTPENGRRKPVVIVFQSGTFKR